MPGPIQSIQRAAEVLKLLAHGGAHQLSVGEISRALDLAKPTVHGILRTLQEVGFVEQEVEGGKYRLGAALFQIGTSYLGIPLLVAAVGGAVVLVRHRRARMVLMGLALGGAACLVLSFGPSLKLADRDSTPREGNVTFGDYLMPASDATIRYPLP